MDKGLQNDRRTIVELWGSLPPEARLYLLYKVCQRRYRNMSRGKKSLVIATTLLAGGFLGLTIASAIHDMGFPVAFSMGALLSAVFLIGLIIGYVTKS